MARSAKRVRLRETSLILAPIAIAVAVVAGAFWFAARLVEPAPPMQLVVATASKGSPYHRIAERYQQYMARNGVQLVLRETTGSFENLKLIKTPGSGVQAAILQGGIAGAEDAPSLQSLGRILYEPVWVFYRGGERLERLSQLAGKRVLVGPSGGGTHFLATRLLAASGVTAQNTTLVNMELPDYVEALKSGKADAGVLVLAPDARTIQRLFAESELRLMSLSQADGLAQRFPYLSKIDLKQGIVDFGRNVPDVDTAMVATRAALVVHEDLHPALANLLTQAVLIEQAQPVVGPNGEAPILQRVREQASASDPEFPMSDEARRVYRSGTPFLQRYLPFWAATLLDRLAVMLVPILGVLLPMLRIGPKLYTWQVRRRLLHWYDELKKVEADLADEPDAVAIAAKRARVEEIDEAVGEIPMPLAFANQLYDLRAHIDLVRRRLNDMKAA